MVNKIHGLEKLVNLEHLNLSDNFVSKMEGLENLSNLKSLNLKYHLGYSDSPIKRIEGIDHLYNLEVLDLSGNEIERLEDLPIDNLKNINVSSNKIQNINYDWLKTLQPLCEINLKRNPIVIDAAKVPLNVSIKL